MTTMRMMTIAVMLAVSAAGAASAQTEQMIATKFAAADTNHDGHLTLDEAKAGMPLVAAHFRRIDKDHKGYVTLDDIIAAFNAHKAGH